MSSEADETEKARKLFAGPCDFVWGAATLDQVPPTKLTEVAFVGRSNAGKSSLINALTGRTALARVSKTPGRTRQINFFDLGARLMLADLPGYGFAKVSKSESAAWQEMIFGYLRGRPTLRRVLLLLDARRGAMDSDRDVMKLLDSAAASYVIVLTKADELSKSEREDVLASVSAEARKHGAAYPDVFLTSAKKGEGLSELKVHLLALTER